MNIAYLSPGGTIGGAEMCLLDILAAVVSPRPDLRARVFLGEGGPLVDRVEALGIPAEVVPLPRTVSRLGDSGAQGPARLLGLLGRGLTSAPGLLGYLGKLAGRIRDFAPDIVQSNGMKMHLLGAWTRPADVPVVWHLHDYLGARPAMARLLRMGARPGVEGVAVSRSVALDAARTLGPSFPIRTIENGVDLDVFRPGEGSGADLDRASGLPPAAEGTVRVGLVATFATWKGHSVFLEAASKIPADRPVRFYIVGGPIYRSAGSQVSRADLEALAGRLGLAQRVGFTGQVDDPATSIRSLDVVVHASTRPEPFGRVIAEGMASGKPLVAMSEGGAGDLFEDGVDALGSPPRDPEALARAILRLIDDPDLRRSLGAAALGTASRRFDRTRLAEDWSPVYDRRLADESTRPERRGTSALASRGSS